MELKNNDGSKASYPTSLQLEYRQGILHVVFEAKNSELYCPYNHDNQPLYEGCAVELFLAEKGDRNSYIEYEFSPNGAVFCGRIDYDKKPNLTMLPTDGISCTASVKGNEYIINAAIAVEMDKEKALFNAYRIECSKKDEPQKLMALYPTESKTFHVPERMRKISDVLQ